VVSVETGGVVGALGFLQGVWLKVVSVLTGSVTVVDVEPTVETLRVLHRTIAEVGEDMQGMRINTAIAKLIVLNNHLTSLPAVPRTVAEQLVLMTAPVAPHLAEELWSRLGHERSLAHEPFPVVDPQYLVQESVTCVFQVQGKVRGRAEVAPDADEATLRELALADPGVQRAMAGRDVRTVIVRAPKLVNVVPA
jgi:leucyl-tRNA synthetase